MELDFDNYFNATVTVFWAVFFVPKFLKEKSYKLLGLTGAAMLVIQVVLSMNYATREFPFNFLAGVSSFFFALFVGYCMYLYESKKEKS
jgi:Ca2+/Na+ antiporter